MDLDHLKKLCEQATPGPWNRHESYCSTGPISDQALASTGSNCAHADIQFVEAARIAVPELLAERSTLLAAQRVHEQTILRMREALKEAVDGWQIMGLRHAEEYGEHDLEPEIATRIAKLREEFGL